MPIPQLSSVYILAGPEIGKRTDFIEEIVSSTEKKDGAAPERYRLYANDTSTDELLDLLRSSSLFASRKIVEFRGVESLTTKADTTKVAAYVKNPAPDSILLLVTESYSIDKAIETAVGAANKKTFFELFENEKGAWIRNRLGKFGIGITEEGVDSMLELVENETGALASACTMLSACFPNGKEISADDVDAALSRSRQEDAFSLFERMVESDLSTALGVLDSVLSDRRGDATQILAALVWSFKRLENLQRSLGAGKTFDEFCSTERIRGKTAMKRLKAASARYPLEECAHAVRAISETDGALRSGLGQFFERPLLHILVTSIMSGKTRGLILYGWRVPEYYRLGLG
jgi:DNA polymerase-3 subunit delta